MARTPSPWYRSERDEWRVIYRGKDHLLGPHPEGYPPPRKQRKKWNAPQPILDRFEDLKAAYRNQSTAPAVTARPAKAPVSVAEVFEKFLAWCQNNRSGRTYEWSRKHIQSFVNALKARPDPIRAAAFPADDLRPFHLTEWADEHRRKRPGKRPWGPNHTRGAITAVQRAYSWAVKFGHLDRNPVRNVEKPPPRRREQVLTPDEFSHLLSRVGDEAFRNVLEFCWETGCRVQEVRVLEAGHYKPDRGRFELPPGQAKGKKRWRLIYLTPRAEEIVRPLVAAHAEGPVFRNADGRPWDAQNFNCRFFRLQRRLGREAVGRIELDPEAVAALARTLPKTKRVGKDKVVTPKSPAELACEARKKLSGAVAAKAGTKYTLTTIRHSFCQRLLEAGVDHTTVAALMGHTDAVMVSRTYSHMDQAKDFLRAELLKATGAQTPAA